MFDQLDRLNAPLRPGPPYDDQVIWLSLHFLIYEHKKYCFLEVLFLSQLIISNHHTTKSKTCYSNKTNIFSLNIFKVFFCVR